MLASYAVIHFAILFLVCTLERERIDTDPGFTTLQVIFEIASGVGTIGLSLGYPSTALYLCTVWSPTSKIILLVVIMLTGRMGPSHHN